MSIADNLRQVAGTLPAQARLIAVSKYHPNEDILQAYEAGQRIFGENHVQEMTTKHATLPQDIEWHFIGHLQTNKVKYLAPYVSMIHSIDSLHLLQEVDKHAAKAGRIIPCLLQIHIATEETKFGFSLDECQQMLAAGKWEQLHHIKLCGLMGMATNTDDEHLVRQEFHTLATFYQEVKDTFFASDNSFKELSMGMSDDYPIAISEGSTLVRIGSKIFGPRHYA